MNYLFTFSEVKPIKKPFDLGTIKSKTLLLFLKLICSYLDTTSYEVNVDYTVNII